MKLQFEQLKKLDDCRYLIPKGTKPGMRTDALIYASEKLLRQILNDLSLEQAINVAFLPGIVGRSLAMPDIHQGYGFPIGGVAATDVRTGVVSPGGVGFDINCGVRLLATSLDRDAVAPRIKELVDQLFRDVPCGAGRRGEIQVKPGELGPVLTRGARWVVEDRGLGLADDLDHSEEGGALAGAEPDAVSPQARKRGAPQIGSLGSGNHFLEVQYVERLFDEAAAAALGLRAGQMVVLIHTGSRGFGHQVCTDYLKEMGEAMRKYNIELPDRQLACVPINSPEGKSYLAAMNAAANFAFANRQVLTHWARGVFQRVLGTGGPDLGLSTIYDVAHNIAKDEEHEVEGRRRKLLVHRKGATRAFPGQPVLVPGDMGRYSFLLLGTEAAMRETFGSTCHGAGRLMSRTAAVRAARGRQIATELEARGVLARATGRDALAEEMPEAYKDVRDVVDIVHRFGISTRVARLRPLAVIKG